MHDVVVPVVAAVRPPRGGAAAHALAREEGPPAAGVAERRDGDVLAFVLRIVAVAAAREVEVGEHLHRLGFVHEKVPVLVVIIVVVVIIIVVIIVVLEVVHLERPVAVVNLGLERVAREVERDVPDVVVARVVVVVVVRVHSRVVHSGGAPAGPLGDVRHLVARRERLAHPQLPSLVLSQSLRERRPREGALEELVRHADDVTGVASPQRRAGAPELRRRQRHPSDEVRLVCEERREQALMLPIQDVGHQPLDVVVQKVVERVLEKEPHARRQELEADDFRRYLLLAGAQQRRDEVHHLEPHKAEGLDRRAVGARDWRQRRRRLGAQPPRQLLEEGEHPVHAPFHRDEERRRRRPAHLFQPSLHQVEGVRRHHPTRVDERDGNVERLRQRALRQEAARGEEALERSRARELRRQRRGGRASDRHQHLRRVVVHVGAEARLHALQQLGQKRRRLEPLQHLRMHQIRLLIPNQTHEHVRHGAHLDP
mmetsp:Transcript_25640/g.84419  ORF Transcript_25640/g.84419 Transcript_25640/m.84419 type:complete len:484 (+) Transcript_25640:373-1824(+)